jgi:hypothetical protein
MGGEAGGRSWREFRETERLILSIDDPGTALEKRDNLRIKKSQSRRGRCVVACFTTETRLQKFCFAMNKRAIKAYVGRHGRNGWSFFWRRTIRQEKYLGTNHDMQRHTYIFCNCKLIVLRRTCSVEQKWNRSIDCGDKFDKPVRGKHFENRTNRAKELATIGKSIPRKCWKLPHKGNTI